jgi:hypothetical protein
MQRLQNKFSKIQIIRKRTMRLHLFNRDLPRRRRTHQQRCQEAEIQDIQRPNKKRDRGKNRRTFYIRIPNHSLLILQWPT